MRMEFSVRVLLDKLSLWTWLRDSFRAFLKADILNKELYTNKHLQKETWCDNIYDAINRAHLSKGILNESFQLVLYQ